MVKAFAAQEAGADFQPFEYDLDELGAQEVEIDVISCGICHSDLSMLENEWGMTAFPFVGGHEVIGKVSASGEQVPGLKVGDTVGVGWFSESCMHCASCLSGDHNLCVNDPQGIIVGRHGGFANKIRVHWACAIPLPSALSTTTSGPLFCGGITVFNPIVQLGIKPTDRVGVIGIGGLGHMALQFLNKWGCEVTAFTSSDSKKEEAKSMGAHNVVNSRNDAELGAIAGSLDFVLSTVNVALNWSLYLNTLAPRGRLHTVGAVTEPMPIEAFSLIFGQKSVSGSPVGSPATIRTMLDFCARHEIAPVIEKYPLSKINDAFQHLRDGKARYRIVVENDI